MIAVGAAPAGRIRRRARAIAGDPFRGTPVDAMKALVASIVVIFPIKFGTNMECCPATACQRLVTGCSGRAQLTVSVSSAARCGQDRPGIPRFAWQPPGRAARPGAGFNDNVVPELLLNRRFLRQRRPFIVARAAAPGRRSC
jgi:hypothetical protein